MQITEITRRAIIDDLNLCGVSWSGRLEPPDFLQRLYDLVALPSSDRRYVGPANLRYHNAGIAYLREDAGLPIRTAIDAYNLMDSYLYGFALQEKTLPGDIAAEAEIEQLRP